MDPRSLKFIAEACNGKLKNGSPEVIVRRVCTDSRQVERGDLFVALVGDKFDAHQFLMGVAQQGAAAVLVEQNRLPQDFSGCAIIMVENTRKALGQIASCYRGDFDIPVIAVGGSNGKTTTKELLAAVLRQKLSVLASEASFNNDIGVPFTLLKLQKGHRAAVLEVGTNHPGELAPLLHMVRPRYGVITSIGREHLEFFGDISGVVQEEGVLGEFLPAAGTLFVNGESDWIKPILKRTRAKVVSVGWGKNDYSARDIRIREKGITFVVDAPSKNWSGEYQIHLLGRYQILNALLALAVGVELGLSRDEIQRGFTECQPAKMRMQLWSVNGINILDDSYNANADSMLAALQTLQDFPANGRRVAILGDMAELGVHSAESHREVGMKAAAVRINHLMAVGKFASETASAARKAGLSSVQEFADVETAAKAAKEFLKPGDVVLLKASRAMRLERVGEFLKSSTVELCKA